MACRRRSCATPKSSEPILANSPTSRNSLSITGLNAGYASVRVLEDISLSVSHAETVVLLGTNGNGKSTLMKCVMGMLRPSSGSIRAEIDGTSVGLAPILVSRTIDKIKELQERFELTVLMAEQNFNQAVRIADRGYVIVHGQIAFEGRNADELNNNELVRKFYLGL